MDSITQGLLGAAVAQVIVRNGGPRVWLYGAVGGMAADLDILIRSADPLVALTYHRHFTHSLLFVPVGGVLSALPWVARAKHRAQAKTIVAATTVGYATHALLDAFTSYGTQLWWPLANTRVAWDWIAIVDPLFSVPLAIGVVLAARRLRARPAALALAWCAVYMGLGGLQHARAVNAAKQLATDRGHASGPIEIEAFPHVLSNVVWRTTYRHDGRIYADWVRTPWFSAVQPHEGESVARATEASLPASVRDNPATLHAFRTFRWFARGWIAFDPNDPSALGDLRYGAGLGSASSMWTLTLAPDSEEPVAFSRHTNSGQLKERWNAIWAE